MNKVIIDTDIFSEILKWKHTEVIENANTYLNNFDKYTISVITVLEIVKGLHKVKRETQIQQFLQATASFCEVITLKQDSAVLAGRIYAELESTGQSIGWADSTIAAIALEHELTLVTGNTKHYQRIVNLNYPLHLENWRNPC
jgi:predicted nucleic acid-binding protein